MEQNPFFGKREKKAARSKYETLFAAVARAINEADPKSLLELGCPPDEYDPEIGTITPRVAKAANADEIRVIIFEEFERWFGADSAGPVAAFDEAAQHIWQAVLAYRQAV